MTALADRLRITTDSVEKQKAIDRGNQREQETAHQASLVERALLDIAAKQAEVQELLVKTAAQGKRSLSYRLSYWNPSNVPNAYERTLLDKITEFAKAEGLTVKENIDRVEGCGGIDPAGPTGITYDFGLTFSW